MKVIDIEDTNFKERDDELNIIFYTEIDYGSQYLRYKINNNTFDIVDIDYECRDKVNVSIESIDNLIKALNILKEEIEKNG